MYCIIFTKCTYNSTVTIMSMCQKNLDFICGNPIWNVTWILWINNPEGQERLSAAYREATRTRGYCSLFYHKILWGRSLILYSTAYHTLLLLLLVVQYKDTIHSLYRT